MFKQIVAIAALGTVLHGAPALAEWPSDQAIEMVVPYSAGGEVDVSTRLISPFIEKHLGRNAKIVIVNKPGASGEIGTSFVQRAKPDGYTFGVAAIPPLIFVPFYKKTQYSVDKLTLVARTMLDPTVVVVSAKSPYKTLGQLQEDAKSSDKGYSVGHTGVGAHTHLGMLLLAKQATLELLPVPFPGTAPARIALAGGHIDLMTTSETAVLADGGATMRPLLQMTSERSPALKDVPTGKELGLDVLMSVDRGFITASEVPASIAAQFQQAVQKAMQDPAFLKQAEAFASTLNFATGEEWKRTADERSPALKVLATEMPRGE